MKKTIVRTLGGIILLGILWQILASWLGKSILVPQPSDALRLFVQYIFTPEILYTAWQTAWKVILSLTFTIMVGLPAGLILGHSDSAYEFFRPLVMMIQTVPVISWLSLVIFMWGIGWKGPIFIAFLSILPTSLLTTVAGVRDLDRDLLEMAAIYQVPTRRVIKDIHVGSLIPFIAAILDVSIGQAWKVIIVAEYLCGGAGLGEEILKARMSVDIPGIWALTLIAVIFGILAERLIKLSIGSFLHPCRNA